MKKLFQISVLFLFMICKAENNKTLNINRLEINLQLEKLNKRNDSLEQKLCELKAGNDSVIETIDKVDNLYNNNFNRFIIFWGIIASIIIVGIPYYISQMQKKILDTKKQEIIAFSTTEINNLESKLYSELKEKYIELSDLINQSNENNKAKINEEFIKSYILNLYIASKINELDKNYEKIFSNLFNAVIKAKSIEYYPGVNFHLKNIYNIFNKLVASKIEFDKKELKNISEELESLRNIEEIDQEILEKVISLK